MEKPSQAEAIMAGDSGAQAAAGEAVVPHGEAGPQEAASAVAASAVAASAVAELVVAGK